MGFRPRVLDYLALAVCLAAVYAAAGVAAAPGAADLVAISSDEGDFLYPLDEDRTIVLGGPLGTTTVEIADGQVRVADDPGPQQICVLQGWISSGGQWLACLPSRIFIEITGAPRGEVDAQTF